MKMDSLSKIVTALTFCLLLSPLATEAAAGKGAGASAPPAASLAAITVSEIPQSVFNTPATPKEGRNPFYPNSVPVAPVAVAKTAAPTIDTTAFVLNGITSPPKRTAMINGRTFEPGEEAEIKLPSGSKVLIKCAEIRDDAATIVIGGVRRELRLRFAL